MSDISLPPEVLNQIIGEAVIGMEYFERDQNYSSFSLVSKNWTSTATSLLLNSLKVGNGTHMKQVLDGVSRTGLGSIVRSLEVIFREERDYEDESKELPTLSQIIEGDMVSVDQFVQLTRLLPSLTQIKLIRPTFIRFNRQDFKDYPDIFQNLITFHLNTFYYRTNSEVLADIMSLAPNLNNLELEQERPNDPPSLAPLKKCNPLRSFKSLFTSVEDQILDLKNPIIPYSSFEGLEELQLNNLRTLDASYTALISQVAPTLTSLIISSFIRYHVLLNLVILLPRLSTIEVLCYEEVEEDFFSHVPLSLSIIKQLMIPLSAFQYLKQNPRAGLNLYETPISPLAFKSPLELITSLPKSLVVISVFVDLKPLANLIGSLESLVGTANYPSSLKTIKAASYAFRGGVLPNNLVVGFAELGISFERLYQ